MTRIIADIEEKADADLIYLFIKRFNAGKVVMMKDEEWEDFLLGKIAEESEKEKETVSRKEVSKWMKKYGVDF